MLIATRAGVDVGDIKRQVPNPNPGPMEPPVTVVSLPVVGITFFVPGDAGQVQVALPLETARELHGLIGKALDNKSDLLVTDRIPPELALAWGTGS